MPFQYTIDVRKIALRMLKKCKIKDVANFTGISRTSIWRWRKSISKGQHILCNKKFQKRDACIPYMIQYLEQRPYSTRASMQKMLASNGISCSLKTVSWSLKKMRYTWKRMKKQKKSKNCTNESKAQYKSTLKSILGDGKEVLFQDESHFSKAVLPIYGYSKAGEPCFLTANIREPAYTLIFAFSTSYKIFYKVYEGAMNKARMQWFLMDIPPVRMVMDNLMIHKCVQTNGDKIFTPVAQPYANPVEIVFSKIKREFRHMNADMPDMDVESLIHLAIATLTSADLDGAIKHVLDFVDTNY